MVKGKEKEVVLITVFVTVEQRLWIQHGTCHMYEWLLEEGIRIGWDGFLLTIGLPLKNIQ